MHPKSFEISPQSLPNDPQNTPKRAFVETLEATFSPIPKETANSLKKDAQREPKGTLNGPLNQEKTQKNNNKMYPDSSFGKIDEHVTVWDLQNLKI